LETLKINRQINETFMFWLTSFNVSVPVRTYFCVWRSQVDAIDGNVDDDDDDHYNDECDNGV